MGIRAGPARPSPRPPPRRCPSRPCAAGSRTHCPGVAGRSAIADLARLAASVPPGRSPDMAPGPAVGRGCGFSAWLSPSSCIAEACPMYSAPVTSLPHAGGRIASQPPTTRHERTFPRKRFVKSRTRRFRGNVMNAPPGASAIQPVLCPRQKSESAWCERRAPSRQLGYCPGGNLFWKRSTCSVSPRRTPISISIG